MKIIIFLLAAIILWFITSRYLLPDKYEEPKQENIWVYFACVAKERQRVRDLSICLTPGSTVGEDEKCFKEIKALCLSLTSPTK